MSKVNKKLEAVVVEEVIELPIVESVALHRIEGLGSNGWVVLSIKTQGEKVIDVQTTEPNMRQIAIEEAKIKFVKLFYDGE